MKADRERPFPVSFKRDQIIEISGLADHEASVAVSGGQSLAIRRPGKSKDDVCTRIGDSGLECAVGHHPDEHVSGM